MSVSVSLPLRIKTGRLPLNYSVTTGRKFFRDCISRAKASINNEGGATKGKSVITGSGASNTRPDFNAGPYHSADNTVPWQTWSDRAGGYTQTTKLLRDVASGHNIRLSGDSLTAIRNVSFRNTFPNGSPASGTVAMLIDIYAPRETVLLGALQPDGSRTFTGNVALDLDVTPGDTFYGQLSGNVHITAISNMTQGRTIVIAIRNFGTAWTLTFDAGAFVKWPAATTGITHPPTQPTALPGGSGIGLYVLRKVQGQIYGEFVISGAASPTATVDLGGTPPPHYGDSGNTNQPGSNRKNPY